MYVYMYVRVCVCLYIYTPLALAFKKVCLLPTQYIYGLLRFTQYAVTTSLNSINPTVFVNR